MQFSQPPAICLSECGSIPEVGSSLSDWEYLLIQQYAECAMAHAQCKAALVERITKEK